MTLKFNAYIKTHFYEVPILREIPSDREGLQNLAQSIGRPVYLYRSEEVDYDQQGNITPQEQCRYGMQFENQEPLCLIMRNNGYYSLHAVRAGERQITVIPELDSYTLFDFEDIRIEPKDLKFERQKLTESYDSFIAATLEKDNFILAHRNLLNAETIDERVERNALLAMQQKKAIFNNRLQHLLSIIAPANVFRTENPLSEEQVIQYAEKRWELLTAALANVPEVIIVSDEDRGDVEITFSKELIDRIKTIKANLENYLSRFDTCRRNTRELKQIRDAKEKLELAINTNRQTYAELKQAEESEERNATMALLAAEFLSLEKSLATKTIQYDKKLLSNAWHEENILNAEDCLKAFLNVEVIDQATLKESVKYKVKNLKLMDAFLELKRKEMIKNKRNY